MTDSSADQPELEFAYRRTGLSAREVWFRYLALGGNADEIWIEGQLHGVMDLPPGEFNVLAHTLNEALDDLPAAERGGRVPYRQLSPQEQLRGQDR